MMFARSVPQLPDANHGRTTALASSARNTGSRGANTVTRVMRDRLKPALAHTIGAEPVKQLARDTGISHRSLEDMRRGARLCDLPHALAIMKARPGCALAKAVDAILSGDAEATSPAAINDFLRQVGWGAR